MEENVDLKVVVQVQEAERNLENLNNTLDETKDKVDDINDSVDSGIPTVGGLDKAFESVFNTLSQEGSKGGAVIKKIFDSVKNAIPTVKALNNTAITGLKGIKAAIVSTGIGLVVIALGEILAHWKDIANWIGIGTKAQEEYTKAVDRSTEAMNRLNFQHEKEIRLLKAAGATSVEIAEAKLRQAKEDRQELANQYYINEALVKRRKEHKALTDEYVEQAKKADEAVKAAERELEIVKEEEKIRAEKEKKARNRGSGTSTGERLKEVKEESKSVVEELRKNGKDVMEIMTAIAHNLEDAFPEESVNYFRKLLDPESVRATTEEVLAELKKAGVKINQTIISGLLEGDVQEYSNELQELISQTGLFYATGYQTLSQNLEAEKAIQLRAFEQEEDILNKRLNLIKEFSGDASAEYKDIESQLVVLGDERQTYIREQARKIAEAVLEERLGVLDASLETLRDQGDRWAGLNGGLWGKGMAEIYKQQQQAQADYFASMRDSYDVGTAEYEAYAQKYEEITERLNGFDGKRTQFVFQQANQQYKYWNDLVSNIGSLFGSLADIYEEDIRARQQRGQLNEEEAEKEFERVKNLQLAEVWINTLSGAIGAFLQASASYPAPWGQILGTATAASVLAAGIAQHAKIKNTSLGGSTGGGGGVSTPNVGVTPIQVTDDIQVSPSALANSQSPADQRVYILEGDIQDSNKRVEVREANSSF